MTDKLIDDLREWREDALCACTTDPPRRCLLRFCWGPYASRASALEALQEAGIDLPENLS